MSWSGKYPALRVFRAPSRGCHGHRRCW